ncbi:hypothetical protein BDY24DRAFT_379311 [Mrakia frigida]|uniref:acyl-CoA desaturase n=1 Tax=Mrakia frigida TaxID=29902 RepID=UPI003FCC1DD7
MDQQPRLRTPPKDGPLSPPLSPECRTTALDGDDTTTKNRSHPSESTVPTNYVQDTMEKQVVLPPITWSTLLQNIQWISFLALTVTPSIAVYGFYNVAWNNKTAIWCFIYYLVSGLGITAGYHRHWSHRSYNASVPLQYCLALAGVSAVQGSIKWWSRGHRAHHRYTDTELDPYNAHRGFWYSHIGWMLLKPRRAMGSADVSDLSRIPVVKWQHKWYVYLLITMGFIVPTVVAGLGWGDWAGGFFFAGAARLVFVHHSTFCVNSLAHWIGETPYDDKHTPKDHFITALVTVGEGYHNFHHQFPMDYRNAIKWYQYDPTKWFICVMYWLGQATHLKTFPANEIAKGQYTMKLKKLVDSAGALMWPVKNDDLPIVSWEDFQEESKVRPLIAVHGFIHDCTSFADEHPGGAHLIKRAIGTDATTAFYGGVYDHSHAAHNLLAMMRVGILENGYEVESFKSDFPGSEIDPDRLLSALPKAPKEQPTAAQANKFTLSVPPSEQLRVSVVVPPVRPGKEARAGQLKGSKRSEVIGKAAQLSYR